MGGSVRSAPVLRSGVLYVTSMAGNLNAMTSKRPPEVAISGRRPHPFHPVSLWQQSSFGCDSGKVYAVVAIRESPGKLPPRRSLTSPVVRHAGVFGGADAHITPWVDTGRKLDAELGGRVYSTAR
jgi:hypothetical protein